MSSISPTSSLLQSVASLDQASSKEAYTARAALNEDGTGFDEATSQVTGDRTTGLFAKKKDSGMGKNDFLQLLLTQMQYQDPLTPMDNSEFMNQLVQLQNIENSTNIQSTLEELKTAYQGSLDAQKNSASAINNAATVSLIGKSVRLQQKEVTYHSTAGEHVPIKVHLGNANEAQVQLVDEEGNVIKTFTATGKDLENSVALSWDGMKDDGTQATAGTYAVNIVGQENNSSLYAFVQDTVAGVRFASDGAYVKVAGQELPIANIMDVSPDESAEGAGTISSSTAVALLGKEVRMEQNGVYFTAKAGEQVTFTVSCGNSDTATVRILDSQGQTVRVLPVTADENGEAEVTWDGRVMDAATLADKGKYTITIDEAKNDPGVYAYIDGVVDGISTVGGTTQLRIGGRVVPLANIIDIAMPQTSTGGAV